jgi:hypothetical protein
MKRGILVLIVMWGGFMLPVLTPEGFGTNKVFLSAQDKEVIYKEIEVGDIPESVNKAFKEYFVDYQINKAYKSDEGSYKLEVSRKDIRYILFYNEKGELIKVEQPENSKQ